jgi:peptidoglycan/LPS O-acetylase OafA/YrhL
VLAWLGVVSYGIYLWHLPLLDLLHRHGVGGIPLAVGGLTLAITCAAVSWYLLEKPITRGRLAKAASP